MSKVSNNVKMLSSFSDRLNLFPCERNHSLVTMNNFPGKSGDKKRERGGEGNRQTRNVTWNWADMTPHHLPRYWSISRPKLENEKHKIGKYENNKHDPLYFQLDATLFQSQKSPQFQFEQTLRSLEVPRPCRGRRSRLLHVWSKHLWNPCRLREPRRGDSHMWWVLGSQARRRWQV